MQFQDLHSFHPAREIEQQIGELSPTRFDLLKQIHQMNRIERLSAEQALKEELAKKRFNSAIANFFTNITSKINSSAKLYRSQEAR